MRRTQPRAIRARSTHLFARLFFVGCGGQEHRAREDDGSARKIDAGPSLAHARDGGLVLPDAPTEPEGVAAPHTEAMPICHVAGASNTFGIESLAVGYGKVFDEAKAACEAGARSGGRAVHFGSCSMMPDASRASTWSRRASWSSPQVWRRA